MRELPHLLRRRLHRHHRAEPRRVSADFEAAAEQIRTGGGGMPAFEGQLSEQEIADVAAYVTQSR
jgi:mono/diheme cytochrome c family protein